MHHLSSFHHYHHPSSFLLPSVLTTQSFTLLCYGWGGWVALHPLWAQDHPPTHSKKAVQLWGCGLAPLWRRTTPPALQLTRWQQPTRSSMALLAPVDADIMETGSTPSSLLVSVTRSLWT
eukprot:2160491-Amphidinium_carterae.1